MRILPPLAAVRVFEAAARHQSFTRAAEELGMTQAAVSYQIKLLEHRLGLPLFLRTGRRVELSDAGRRAARQVTLGLDRIADAFAGLLKEDAAVLTISTTQTFASNWLAQRLGTFQLARPGLAVRLDTQNHIIDFDREAADAGIRAGHSPDAWPGLTSHFLFRLHATPLCSPEFRDRHRINAPEDLLDVPLLSSSDRWWDEWFELVGLPDRGHQSGGLRLDAQVMEGTAAMAGAGAAILTPAFWRAELASGRLVQLFPQVQVERRAYWLVYPDYKRLHPKITAFRDWIAGEVQAMAGVEPPSIFTPAE